MEILPFCLMIYVKVGIVSKKKERETECLDVQNPTQKL